MTEKEIFFRDLKSAMDADYIYDTYHDSESSYCNCHESICRCKTLNNLRVTKGTVVDVSDKILRHTKDPLLRYCVERLVRSNKTYDTNAWDISKVSGYYGEECGEVTLKIDVTKKIIDESIKLYAHYEKKYTVKMVLFVLEREYGYVLDGIKNVKNATIEKVDTKKLVIGASEHYQRLDTDIVDQYAEHKYPLGVVLKNNEKYRLIDGYHRVAASTRSTKNKIDMVTLS